MELGIDKDTIIEKLMIEELRLANKHLPMVRMSLYDLLKMEFPHVVLRDGTKHFFRKRELLKLASMLSEEEAKELKLPIVIVMRPDIGEGVGVVEGKIEVKVIAKILGIEERGDRLFLYKPQLAMLREHFDTVIQFAISVSFEEESTTQFNTVLREIGY